MKPRGGSTALAKKRHVAGSAAEAQQQQAEPQPPAPIVEFIEQPTCKPIRFRYPCENRTTGTIPGASSTGLDKTVPAIRIRNYVGQAVIVVSAVATKEPHFAHPYNLVGPDCKHGVLTLNVDVAPGQDEVQFEHVGIQCVPKKEVTRTLNLRREKRLDPFHGE